MTFREIEFGSADYRLACELRNQILRMPLGMNLFDEDLTQEQHQRHFGLFDGKTLIACVIAVALSPAEAKIRQMAVATDDQGRGCGRKLIRHLEDELIQQGFIQCSLHARSSAVGFYEKSGYSCSGDEFLEMGMPHVRMEKILA